MRRLAALLLSAALAAPAMAEAPAPAPVEASLLAPVLRVSESYKVARFYQSILGMKVLMSRDFGRIHETLLAFGSTPARPAIMLVSSAAGMPAPEKGIGMSRLIISVADVDAVVSRAVAAGLESPQVRSPQPGVRVVDLRDPEGNELELVEQRTAARAQGASQ